MEIPSVLVAMAPMREGERLSLEQSIGFAVARLGLIIPAGNRLIEPQFQHFAPKGMGVHVARLQMNGKYKKPFPQLLEGIAGAASTLADAGVDLIGFHCTATSMAHGPEGDAQIRETITRETGTASFSTGQAVVEALARLAVKRLVLVTPYTKEQNDEEGAYLRRFGVEVIHDVALKEDGDCGPAPLISPARWIDIVRANQRAAADAYFLSCANTTQIDTIVALERELGKPVINSNQAMLWASFHRLKGKIGPMPHLPGLGRLANIK